MATFTLFCCVIALPILVLGYKQEWRERNQLGIESPLPEASLLKSERGWIGCLYNPKVCEDDEQCVNDNLFGVCRSEDSNGGIFIYDYKDLSDDWKRLLEKELITLASKGYRWTDVYTQCILRSTLLSYRSSSFRDASLCRVDSESKDSPAQKYRRIGEEAELISPQDNTLANEGKSAKKLAQLLVGADAEKRDAMLRLHKYYDKDTQMSPSDYEWDNDYNDGEYGDLNFENDNDLSRLRQQLLQLKSIQENAQDSLNSDSLQDLKDVDTEKPLSVWPEKERPQNADLSFVTTLLRNKVDSSDRKMKRAGGMGHAQMKYSAENMSPEEALSELRPSKRFPVNHLQEANAERAGRELELEREEELSAYTVKPQKVVDSRWVFLLIQWPKESKTRFQSRAEVKEFLDAVQEKIGVPHLYNTFQYFDTEVDFQLTEALQENPQAILALLKNVTEPIAGGPLILDSGLGLRQKVPSAKLAPRPKHFGVTFAVCGAVLFIIIAVIIVFFMQRYRISKSKVFSLTKAAEQGESREAYQDLCRHRMQSKSGEKTEPVSAAARAVGPALTRGDSNSAGSTRSSTSSWSEEPIHSNMDISTGHLILSYMEEHLNNKEKLESEWNNLCAYQPDCVKCDIGKREENLNRNRYLDNIPYDNNHVELKTAVEGSTYFNASYVINHDPKNPVYIITQGPLPNTIAQFWQMVWEQGSIVIVNLTRLVEDGISLCQKYWPEEGSELYNNYEVHLVSEHVWCEDYLVRSFYLKNVKTGETRTVTQFHFLSWPDLGEPSTVKTLLDFRRKVNKSYKGRSCPVVVHCSDGCGRSGTYILLDMVLNRLAKGVKEIDISAAVEHLRDQRCQMVKTKGQFEFVLTAIAEEVHAMLKSLPQ